jgi:hypothetical protein
MKKLFKRILIASILFGINLISINKSFAIPNTKQAQLQMNEYITKGSFRGGQAGNGFSLKEIKRVVSASKNSERMIFEVSDRDGKTYSGKPGYFHAQLMQNPSRISIDFAQMGRSAIDAKKLTNLFKKSQLVRASRITLDNEDQSVNVTLYLKNPVKLRAFSLAPKAGTPKVVIDFTKL